MFCWRRGGLEVSEQPHLRLEAATATRTLARNSAVRMAPSWHSLELHMLGMRTTASLLSSSHQTYQNVVVSTVDNPHRRGSLELFSEIEKHSLTTGSCQKTNLTGSIKKGTVHLQKKQIKAPWKSMDACKHPSNPIPSVAGLPSKGGAAISGSCK